MTQPRIRHITRNLPPAGRRHGAAELAHCREINPMKSKILIVGGGWRHRLYMVLRLAQGDTTLWCSTT